MTYNTHLKSSGESVTDVPIIFDDNGNEIHLTLKAGTHGTQQNSDGSVQTVRGYCLTEIN